MKKYLKLVGIMLLSIMTFVLCACGDEGSTQPAGFEGNYAVASDEKLAEIVTNSKSGGKTGKLNFSKGISLTMTMISDEAEVENGITTTEKTEGTIEIKSVYKNNKVGFYSKMINKNTETETNKPDEVDEDYMEITYADGVSYSFMKTALGDVKTKATVQIDMNELITNSIGNMMDDFDFEDIFEEIKEMKAGTYVAQNKTDAPINLAKAEVLIDDSNANAVKVQVNFNYNYEIEKAGKKGTYTANSTYYFMYDQEYNVIGLYADATITENVVEGNESETSTRKISISALPFDDDILAPADANTYLGA